MKPPRRSLPIASALAALLCLPAAWLPAARTPAGGQEPNVSAPRAPQAPAAETFASEALTIAPSTTGSSTSGSNTPGAKTAGQNPPGTIAPGTKTADAERSGSSTPRALFAAGSAALTAGEFERATESFEAALSRAQPREREHLRLALAQAALLAGDLPRATASLEALPEALPAPLAERRALLAAALRHRRAERQAELARTVEAEPFAWQAALRDLEAAEQLWRQALDLGLFAGDRPEQRRNWQRTRALRLEFERQAAAAQKPPESTPEPPPPGETEIVAEQPQAAPPEPAALGPDDLLLLLERLEARARIKRAEREQRARRSAASGQRDW